MSYNQSTVEKGGKSGGGGRSGHGRGFAGGGRGGGGAPLPNPANRSTNNQSFKRAGDGQGGQSRVNPASVGSDTSTAGAALSYVQNGAHGPLSQDSSTTVTPGGPKPDLIPKSVDAAIPRTSPALPKAPSQSTPGISFSAEATAPVKGLGIDSFSFQFGSISPACMTGVQIPARTSSALPNLDEQMRFQARHDSLSAVPTQPISSGPQPQPQPQPQMQQQPARKDAGVNQFTNPEPHPPVQVKKEVHQQILTAPVAPMPRISNHPQFQQPPIPMQFSGPRPQQIPMTLPIRNSPQVPRQMFVPNLQSHPLQPQPMIHQGQGFNFGPQISHHLHPQIQFAQQQQQQQGNFVGPRKSAVKITHPDTHEELRLGNNAMPQPRPIASFSGHPHYFPQMQPNSYTTPPRFNYAVGQNGQFVSLMNTSSPMNTPVNSAVLSVGPRSVGPSVTISMPIISKAEEPKLDHQKKSSQKDVSPSQQQTDESSLSSIKTSMDGSFEEVQSRPLMEGVQNIHESPRAEKSFTPTSLPSSGPEVSVSTEARTGETGESMAKNLNADPCQDDNASLEVRCRKDMLAVSECENSEVCEVSTEETGDAIPYSSEDVACSLDSEANSLEKHNECSSQDSRSQLVSTDADLALDLTHKKSEAVSMEAPVTSERTDKEKPSLESTEVKATTGKKMGKKGLLSKADAAGTSDLYNAYKGAEEKQQHADTSETLDSSLTIKIENPNINNPDDDAVAIDDATQTKSEVDDWEEAVGISTPKLEKGQKLNDASEATGRKRYTRDFLLTFSELCVHLPQGFQIGFDIVDVLMCSSQVSPNPSPGKATERSPGVSRGDDKWKQSGSFPSSRPGASHGVLRNPRAQHTNQSVPILAAVPQGGQTHNFSSADRWRSMNNSRGLMPPPPLMPLQVMHKAEKKYEVGKVSNEEQAKQRQLKAILNKLTPQNFEKLFQKVSEVNIDNTDTLSGVISQIFDKALMEPTFCEMYADFCFRLSDVLPDFVENDQKITFKRLLLTKCQVEFERGDREQHEANRIEAEGEAKQSEEGRDAKRVQARRRMLGNIRLIGELYKKKMITERIMHDCIGKLLGQQQNPDEEGLEALCKLMSTIGKQIDHPKSKPYIDQYFKVMQILSTDEKLSSRVRFMLRDVIDLRKDRWNLRRKIDGPKKIEEVHRDAAQERQFQTSTRSAWGPNTNSNSRRGSSSVLPSPKSQSVGAHGFRNQNARSDGQRNFENSALLIASQGPIDDGSISVEPQGGLARGMFISGQASKSGSNGYNSTPDQLFDKFTASSVNAGQNHESLGATSTVVSDTQLLSEEVPREKSFSAIKEFYSAKDEEEVALHVKELNYPSFYPSMVSLWVMDSFERKDMERDLLATLLINLCKSRGLLTQAQFGNGFEMVLASLEDAVNDAPKAPEFLGRIFAKVILENVVPLRDIGKLIHEGGEEPGSLLESGLASEVICSILEIIREEKGEPFLKEIITSSKLRLQDFRPTHTMNSNKLDAFL